MSDMRLNFILMCDQAFQDPASGKGSIIGIFDTIGAKAVPTVHPRFFVVVNTSGNKGSYAGTIEIINKKNDEVIASARGMIEMNPKGANTLVVNFVNVVFPAFGSYWLKFTIDGNILTTPESHYIRVEENEK